MFWTGKPFSVPLLSGCGPNTKDYDYGTMAGQQANRAGVELALQVRNTVHKDHSSDCLSCILLNFPNSRFSLGLQILQLGHASRNSPLPQGATCPAQIAFLYPKRHSCGTISAVLCPNSPFPIVQAYPRLSFSFCFDRRHGSPSIPANGLS